MTKSTSRPSMSRKYRNSRSRSSSVFDYGRKNSRVILTTDENAQRRIRESLSFEGALHNGTGTEHKKHSGGHKRRKKKQLKCIFCASCVLFCASCVPFPICCATPRQ